MIKLTVVQYGIIHILLYNSNITFEEILCNIGGAIDIKVLRKNIKGLVDEGYIACKNIGFMKDNGKPGYHKRYSLSYSYHKQLLSDMFPGVKFDKNVAVIPDYYDDYYIKHRNDIIYRNCIEKIIKLNDKKIITIGEWNSLMRLVKGEKKGEQVRVNGVKDPDLKQMIHDVGKQAKILQMEREANQDVSDEDIESLINN